MLSTFRRNEQKIFSVTFNIYSRVLYNLMLSQKNAMDLDLNDTVRQ